MTRLQVLVVDDEPQIQSLLRIALGSAGYEVLPATTGREVPRFGGQLCHGAVAGGADVVDHQQLGRHVRDGERERRVGFPNPRVIFLRDRIPGEHIGGHVVRGVGGRARTGHRGRAENGGRGRI